MTQKLYTVFLLNLAFQGLWNTANYIPEIVVLSEVQKNM